MSDFSYRPVRSPIMSMGPSLEDERRRHRHARVIAAAGVVLLAAVVLVTWFIGLMRHEVITPDARATGTAHASAPPSLPVGAPQPQRLADAVMGRDEPSLRLQLPINRDAVTGIGFGVRDTAGVVELRPSGERANQSWGRRLLDRFLATTPPGSLTWYQLNGRGESMVTIGAAPGTDAYAPIEGRVLAIVPYRVSGVRAGDVVHLQPLGDARTIIVIRNIDADPSLQVGQATSEGSTRIGTVRDVTQLVSSPLARFTHDSGSGIDMYVVRSDAPDELALSVL